MSFPSGARVKFLHSSHIGTVTEVLDEKTVSVFVEDWDMEVPVPVEDLILASASVLKPKPQPAPIAKKTSEGRAPTEGHTSIRYGTGILLAFEAILNNEGLPEKYRLFLINDTSGPILYELDLFAAGEKRFGRKGRLDAFTWQEQGQMPYDDLNELPEARAACWKIEKDGTGSRNARDMRIKPKAFFSCLTPDTPLLHRQAHVLTLFETLGTERTKGKAEDLKTYTQRNAPKTAVLQQPQKPYRTKHEVREAAEFSIELDLHIEKLAPESTHLSNAQILQLQLRVFEEYMDKAIRLGMERVFIIHGIGKGRLRDVIASRLLRMPEAITFKNEYHPKYGHGATEVVLI